VGRPAGIDTRGGEAARGLLTVAPHSTPSSGATWRDRSVLNRVGLGKMTYRSTGATVPLRRFAPVALGFLAFLDGLLPATRAVPTPNRPGLELSEVRALAAKMEVRRRARRVPVGLRPPAALPPVALELLELTRFLSDRWIVASPSLCRYAFSVLGGDRPKDASRNVQRGRVYLLREKAVFSMPYGGWLPSDYSETPVVLTFSTRLSTIPIRMFCTQFEYEASSSVTSPRAAPAALRNVQRTRSAARPPARPRAQKQSASPGRGR
jgi:hypothetical protein